MTTLFTVVFLVLFAVILVAISLGVRFLETQRKKQVEDVLNVVSGDEPRFSQDSVLLNSTEDDTFEQFLEKIKLRPGLTSLLRQSGLDWSSHTLLLAMAGAAVLGGLLGALFNPLVSPIASVVVCALILLFQPLLFLIFKRGQRMHEIEAQLPEALDFLARSMRAGHAFSISVEMVGEELPNPLGREFRTLFNELNLGAPTEVALANMAARVPLLDMKLFASSVELQRQTGGNLSEVLVRLAFVIRERFRLRGQVRAASAHGRLTALVLALMPVVMFFLMPRFAPGYIQSMLQDPDGRLMLVGAAAAQVLGFLIMRRITNIKV